MVMLAAMVFGARTASDALGACPLSFTAMANYPTGVYPRSLAIGDLNGDGHEDLVVGNSSGSPDPTLAIYLAQGDGSYDSGTALNTGGGWFISIDDLNNDNRLDIVTTHPGAPFAYVFLGNGNGTFGPQAWYSAGSTPGTPAVDDFNSDGVPDLAVPLRGSLEHVAVLMGNGDGTFQTPIHYTANTSPWKLASGDFNGDGRADLAVGGTEGNISILLNTGLPNPVMFADQVRYPCGVAISVTVADLNFDSRLDLITTNGGSASVLLGNGDGTFQAAASYPAGSSPVHAAVADLDNDGVPDLAVANEAADTVSVLVGSGSGGFAAPVSFGVGDSPVFVATGRLNTDSRTDLVTANAENNNFSVLLNTGFGFAPPVITEQPECQLVQAGAAASLSAVVTMNGNTLSYQWRRNGAPLANGGNISGATTTTLTVNPATLSDAAMYDLMVTSPSACSSETHTTTSDPAVLGIIGSSVPTMCPSSFASEVRYDVGECTSSVAVGDLNADGFADLAVANQCSAPQDLSIFLGNGDGTYGAVMNYAVGSTVRTVSIGDLNGDGVGDVVVVRAGAVSVLLGNGDGTIATPMHYAAGSNSFSAAIGDLNGDGAADLAVTNSGSNNVSMLLGNGDGTFAAPAHYGVGGSPQYIATGDLNNDGMLDLAVANSSSNDVSVLLGIGSGAFATAVNFAAGSGVSQVAVGDLNGDGRPDLAVANYGTGSVAVLTGNGDGTFQAPTNHATGSGNVRSVGIADFNGDGRLDLAMTREFGNRVSVLLGIGCGAFATAVHYAVSGIPTFLSIGDLNGDGRPDLAVASFGGGDVSVLMNQSPSIQIGSHPVNQTVAAGATAIFSATVAGDGLTALQWRRNGVPLLNGGAYSGVTTDTLTITDVLPEDEGAYDLRIIGGGCNESATVTSRPATLRLSAAPVCMGDFNLDEVFDAMDIQGFVDALMNGETCP